MFTAGVAGGIDALYIIQPSTGKMCVYDYNFQANRIESLDAIKLDQAFKQTAGAGPAKVPAAP